MAKEDDKDKDKDKEKEDKLGLGGLLGGLSAFMEQFKELAEKQKSSDDDKDNPLNGIFGFNIRSLMGEEGHIKVEPFGNVRRDAEGKATVHAVREPMVDVFEEEDHVLVLAEMPGVGAEHIKVEIEEDLLFIEAANGDKRYRKEVLLSVTVPASAMTFTCHNGVLQVRLKR